MGVRKTDRRFPVKTTVFVVLITSLILAVPIAHLIWGAVAAHHLKKTLILLRAQGEPLTPSEIIFDSAPDAENASLNYRLAGDSIDHAKPALKKYENSDPNQFQLPLTSDESAVIQTILTDNQTALTQINAAHKKVAGGWNDHFEKMQFPVEISLNGERDLCNLLKLSAMQAHMQGNDRLAVDRLQDLLSVSDATENRPTFIAHLVAIGTTAFTGQTIHTIAANLRINAAGLSMDQLHHMLTQLLDESHIEAGNKLGWRSERIIELNFLDDIINGKPVFTRTILGEQEDVDTEKYSYVLRPILLNNENFLALYLQNVMLASEQPNWPAALQKMPTTARQSVQNHPYLNIFLTALAPAYDKAIMAGYHAKAERRLAATAIAVRLFAADHNNTLPNQLTDLIPTYLPAIPIDPMSGQPMKFKPDPPRIYSVGDDGVDDNGIPVDIDSPNPFYRHHGDIVAYLTPQSRKSN